MDHDYWIIDRESNNANEESNTDGDDYSLHNQKGNSLSKSAGQICWLIKLENIILIYKSGSKDRIAVDCGEDYGLKFNKKHFSSSVMKKRKDCETQSKSKSGE